MPRIVSRGRVYLELIRYPLFAIPLVATLPGVVLASSESGWTLRAPLALLTALLGYFAGMIKNDYFHRESDVRTNPHRPIPSGRIAPRDALRLASGLYAFCLVLGFAMNPLAGAMVVALIAISHSYNAYLKVRGIWGSLVLPFGIGLLSVFGAVSVSGRVPTLVWFSFAGTFLYDFGTHIASTFKDIERDASLGIRTTPLQMGRRPALMLSTGATVAAFVVSVAPVALGVSPLYAVWVGVAFVATLVTRLPLLREPTEKNGYRALEGSMVAAIVLFPALVATVLPFGAWSAVVAFLLWTTRRLLRTSKQEI